MASLEPLSGTLGTSMAAHLLRRATYRVTPSRIKEFAKLEVGEAVDLLFSERPLLYPNGPLSWTGNNDPIIDISDKTKGAYVTDVAVKAIPPKARFTHNWRMLEAIHDGTIRWKLAHFFSAIYSDKPNDEGSIDIYHQWRLFIAMALNGDLKTLAKKVSLDNRMLIYLNNEENVKLAPNENYAREFLELFTILKGDAVSEDNYTNYTEADISTAAKVLTGFRTGNRLDPDTGIASGVANFYLHDATDKTFSDAFQNQTILGATDEADMYRELSDFVDMVFNQEATAIGFVRRMYLYFVSDKITPDVENYVIAPLATELKSNGYQHVPVLKQLLKSAHFYDRDDQSIGDEVIGAKIKSPYEWFFQTINLFDMENPAVELNDYYKLFLVHHVSYSNPLMSTGMNIQGPPTVENFPGYFKAPNFSKNWISNNLLYDRLNVHQLIVNRKIPNSARYFDFKTDIIDWVKNHADNLPGAPGSFENGQFDPIGASNYRRIVKVLVEYLLPNGALFYEDENPAPFAPQNNDRLVYFENTLLGGLSPVNWYFVWLQYINGETGDMEVRVGLERTIKAITSALEFQTF